MNRQRIPLSVISLFATAAFTGSACAQSTKAIDPNDCGTLSTITERVNCRSAHEQLKTFFLQNTSTQVAANEIVTALRNMFDPSVKIYLLPTQNAIVVETYPQEVAQIEAMIHTLDVPLKSYRLTYTLATKEDGKVVGTQHYSMIAVNGQKTTMKQGEKVPVATGSFSMENASSQTQFTYLDVGMNFDATVTSQENGVALKTKVEQSSIGKTQTIAGVTEPVVQQSVLDGSSFMPLGKPLMLGSIDLPNSTRHIDVDVMVEQVK